MELSFELATHEQKRLVESLAYEGGYVRSDRFEAMTSLEADSLINFLTGTRHQPNCLFTYLTFDTGENSKLFNKPFCTLVNGNKQGKNGVKPNRPSCQKKLCVSESGKKWCSSYITHDELELNGTYHCLVECSELTNEEKKEC